MKFPTNWIVLLWLEIVFIVCKGESKDTSRSEKLLFVVLSQTRSNLVTPHEYLRYELTVQADDLGWARPNILYTHRYPHDTGAWTIFPILHKIHKAAENCEWIIVCSEGTRVHFKNLIHLLLKYNSSEDWFLGRELRDREPTIIHQFAFHENPSVFPYPDLASGFVLSFSLLDKLVRRRESFVNQQEFSIDPYHEFAMFVKDNGKGTDLVNVREFCIEDHTWCATYYVSLTVPDCGTPVLLSEILFAVKSCKEFEDRVSVVLQTWGHDSNLNLLFFTDSSNSSYPRVDLGIPNTITGHCEKTLGILKYAAKQSRSMSWLMIADDDTLVSVPRLLKFLSCFNPLETWALGERYGFHTSSGQGYDYITGGGGMVFSQETVKRLTERGICMCPSNDAPDDMILGKCLEILGIPVTHSPHFHQARPMDYPEERLHHEEPITFHKFWMMDPVREYQLWLQDHSSHSDSHDEL